MGPSSLPGRIIGLVILTFVIAMVYGFFLTTRDFMNPNFDPVATGHHAAAGVYDLFGTVSGEIERNDDNASARTTTIAHKIAVPYATTADLTAIFGGKLEAGLWSFFRAAQGQVDNKIHNARS